MACWCAAWARGVAGTYAHQTLQDWLRELRLFFERRLEERWAVGGTAQAVGKTTQQVGKSVGEGIKRTLHFRPPF